MTDYAVSPIQPIVQGVVTFPLGVGPATPVAFNGEGISFIERLVGQPLGCYLLTLDEGLPGNAGAVPPGTSVIADPNVQTMITVRGSPGSTVVGRSVLYLTSPEVGVGANQILIVLRTLPPGFVDPPAGFEIIVWRVL